MKTGSRTSDIGHRTSDIGAPKWKVTISNDDRGRWCFSYNGKLTAWQIICTTLAGWKIERIKK